MNACRMMKKKEKKRKQMKKLQVVLSLKTQEACNKYKNALISEAERLSAYNFPSGINAGAQPRRL